MHPFIYAFAAGVVIFAWKRYICKKPIGKWFKTGCVVCVVLMVIYYVCTLQIPGNVSALNHISQFRNLVFSIPDLIARPLTE